jgi:amino acid adenylation domain-containing protein
MTSTNLVSAFEKVVKGNGGRLAVASLEKNLNYGELNEYANGLANDLLLLRKTRSEGSNHVALLLGHSAEMIVSILGVLKVGMTYVPLDPSYPRERLTSILSDCKAKYLVTDESNISLAYELIYSLQVSDIEIVDIAEVKPDTQYHHSSSIIKEDTEAYIMYTSGSTGIPKGVFQNHKSILNMCQYFGEQIDIGKEDNLLLTTSYNHTVSAIDIFATLLHGACISLFNVRNAFDKLQMLKMISERSISILHTVPTLFRYVIGNENDKNLLSSIRLVILGGEDVLKSDVDIFKEKFSEDCMFVNLYGQSELIISAMYVLDKGQSFDNARVPIGSPIEIIQTKIINDHSGSAQVFEEGELVITSEYITSGYVTPENPSRIVAGQDGKKILFTGDIVRVLPDGNLEFIGRKDSVVKIDGNRVDLFEIEAVLNFLKNIKRSVVLIINRQIVTFYESTDGVELDSKELRSYLHSKLPDFMIPAQFVFLNEFPLTKNGKTDRQVLATYKIGEATSSSNDLSKTELELLEIWKDLFNNDQISIQDNFFQLGGNSLLATEMINKIFLQFECELELHSIFDCQTIHELAKVVENARLVIK